MRGHSSVAPGEHPVRARQGHVKDAFTGASTAGTGYFERADGGTIFLDEIGELPLEAQTRFLHVLQGKTFERVGGGRVRTADVRVVAATHRSLGDMVREGTFRQDLYFRLNVFPITIPPLRERMGDLSLDAAMARHIVRAMRSVRGRIEGPGGAAELLGVNPRTLQSRMKRLGVPFGRKAGDMYSS